MRTGTAQSGTALISPYISSSLRGRGSSFFEGLRPSSYLLYVIPSKIDYYCHPCETYPVHGEPVFDTGAGI